MSRHRARRALRPTWVLAGALAATGALPLVAPAALAEPDLDCADLTSRAQAQALLDANPSDPNRLDTDRDGQACETWFGADDATASEVIVPQGAADTGDGSLTL